MLLLGQGGSAVVSLGVAICLSLGFISTESSNSWWILAVASVGQGIIMGLMMPSRQAILPELVSGEQLMNAISLNNMGMNVLRLLAPALSGFLIDSVGFEAVYYITTGAYISSVFFIWFLPRTGKMTASSRDAISEIKGGLKYMRRERTIFVILILTMVATVLSNPFMQLMPVFTDSVLHVGATELGILMSVSGAGAIAGSLLLASLPNKKRGLLMLIGMIINGIALVIFAFSTHWITSISVIAFVGLGQTGMMAISNTLLQYYVEDEYRGRVMSILMMQFGVSSFSTFIAGVLSDNIGPQWSIGGLAIILLVVSVWAILFIPRIRKLD